MRIRGSTSHATEALRIRQRRRRHTHQASILDHLDEVDAIVTDLAGHMGVTVATMSLAVDRLEGRYYVRRIAIR
jgi:DNA-binding MarR family transcriptional regulator